MPLADALAEFDAPPDVVEDLIASRRLVTQTALVPVPGALETIAGLRERGLSIGLIASGRAHW